jgi:hypothetical protein
MPKKAKGRQTPRGPASDPQKEAATSSKDDETGSTRNQSGKDPPETPVSDRAEDLRQNDADDDARSATFPKGTAAGKRPERRPTVETERESQEDSPNALLNSSANATAGSSKDKMTQGHGWSELNKGHSMSPSKDRNETFPSVKEST